MDVDAMAELASARNIYILLGRLFLAEVDRDIFSLLRSKEMAEPLAPINAGLLRDGMSDDDVMDALAVEYSFLFIQPGSFPPYESVFRKGRYLAESADQVEVLYQLNGFNYREQWPSLFPDHLGVEMNFAASLIDAELKAMKDGRAEEAKQFNETRANFLLKRLCEWGPQYLEKAAEMTSDPFYNPLIHFTKSFFECEAEAVAGKSGSAVSG